MLFTQLIVTLCVGIAFAADANSVVAIIKNVQINTNQLNLDVQRYNGGVAGLPYALQVQQDAVLTHEQIVLGITEANNSAPFGEPGSFNVAGAFLDLSNTVTQTLRNVSSKQAAFKDLRPIVLASLYQLQQDTRDFGAASIAKLAALEAAAAPLVVQNLVNEFNNAIMAYGGKAT
ncbi:hypothetical protein EJ05DRAFT_481745 [Pseudovirgaria hyperparasitica]|uniref:Antigenic cell wall galactomanno protein n=1 Tax=Pseudovirgaria hyperparasitica TaxID=470096 RepID=A0A6A6WL07_9PEZI|nr:uncharacterized protein EJ05DRAFT_481745 [Pseudovirgaria hyperparasitica]KAF2762868.1 hypothetical protein EJ05DRAFT_481745 [Pseudovirgaria hyperparasitica]